MICAPQLALLQEPAKDFEVMRVVDHSARVTRLVLDVWSERYQRHYLLTWSFSDQQIEGLRHAEGDDPDYRLSDAKLDGAEEDALWHWLHSDEGPGSADGERRRIVEALREYQDE